MRERISTSQIPSPLSRYSGQPDSPSKPVYKYIRNVAGVVGTIHDQSGVFPQLLDDHYMLLGDTRATYLESHGYGTAEVARIVRAFTTYNLEEFITQAAGCGMSEAELEWFWNLK